MHASSGLRRGWAFTAACGAELLWLAFLAWMAWRP
jgi:hypothetical protein